MPRYIQFDQDNFACGFVTSETPPVHDNQYEMPDDFDFSLVSGKVYNKTKKAFFEPKIVADFDALVLQMETTLGAKVSV
jgi:hypothetical protein